MRGIYILANDRVVNNAVTLLNSIRKYDPDTPILIIPYDDNCHFISDIPRIYKNVRFYEDFSLIERLCGNIRQIFGDKFFIRPDILRKQAAWFGSFDEFLYIDTDIVVFEKIIDNLDYLSNYDFVCCDYQRKDGIKYVFTPKILEDNVFSKDDIRDIFNGGFWGSKKGLISEDDLYEVFKECVSHPEYFDFSQGVSDMPIINYLVLKRIPRRFNIVRGPSKGPGSWAGSQHFKYQGNRLVDPNVNQPLKYLHWAGIRIEPGCPYWDIWKQYRYLNVSKGPRVSQIQSRDNLPKPFVSVVIPVYNDSERLKICLQALENQTYSKNRYEVIIVDNDSDECIEGMVNYFGHTVVTHESYPSLCAARNKGISLAKGDILAFTDADCIPAPDWIEKGVANLLRVPDCGLVAGKIEVFGKDSGKPTAVELFESITAFPQKKYIERWKFGAMASVFTFRKVINNVGFLNGTLKGSGDVEWGQRVFSYGYKQVYADDTCVAHPARYSFTQLYRKHVRIVGGLYDLRERKKYPFKTFIKDLINDWPILKDVLQVCSDRRLKGCIQKVKVLFVMLFVKCVRIWERIRLRLGGKSKR